MAHPLLRICTATDITPTDLALTVRYMIQQTLEQSVALERICERCDDGFATTNEIQYKKLKTYLLIFKKAWDMKDLDLVNQILHSFMYNDDAFKINVVLCAFFCEMTDLTGTMDDVEERSQHMREGSYLENMNRLRDVYKIKQWLDLIYA
jgi:hypothetical protein